MSPLRSSRAARLLALPRALSVRVPALAPALAMLLLAGCSNAGDGALIETTLDAESGASASLSEPGETGRGDSSGEQGEDPPATSTDAGESGGGEDTTSGGAPEPAPGEPILEDLLEAKANEIEGCDLVTPVSVQLRTLDAAATVSPTQARDAALSNWVSLTGIRIRPWEFFNYYAFDYPPAEAGMVAITPQMVVQPGAEGSPEFVLQIGVTTQALAAEQRPPLRLTLALDNSNSMAGKAEDMLRATVKAIAGSLRQGDTLSIVTWNSKSTTILEMHPISGPSDPVVLEKLDQLELGGSAELYSGLMVAYKLAVAAHDPTAWNRVVLVSDGGATANDTDLAVIADHADKLGIYLSSAGVGDAGTYRSDMMDATAHAGRGASLFIGSDGEADKRFGAQLVRTLGPAVRDVDVRLELPPGFEVVRDPAADALNDSGLDPGGVRLGPNASLVLHRRLRSCDADAETDLEAKLLVRVAFVDEATGELREAKAAVKLATLLAQDKTQLAQLYKGAAVQAYTEALQRWQAHPADLMATLDGAAQALAVATELLPNDAELAEIAAVLAVLSAG
jgi:Ca-activated chloride channel family protein